MSGPCPKCPCAGICLRWNLFCNWAAEDPADPLKLRHICGRSGMPANPGAMVRADGRSAAQAVTLTRLVHACPFRNAQGCGCAGARCALRDGAIVSHAECFDCVERYG